MTSGLYIVQPIAGGWGARIDGASRLSRRFGLKREAKRWAEKRARFVYVLNRAGEVEARLYGNQMRRRDGCPPAVLTAGSVAFRVKPARWNLAGLVPFRWYWTVRVFETREAMHAYGEWRSANIGPPEYEGKVMPLPRVRMPERYVASKLGECVLWRGALGTGVIVHECLHMATSTMRARRDASGEYDSPLLSEHIDGAEEELAYTLTSISRQVVDALYAAGYYTGPPAGGD